MPHSKKLKRIFTPWTLSFYGIGSILGAGIYTVIGEVAGVAGEKLWISFVIAMFVALLTGLTYAELGSRFPSSGAESHFAKQAFRKEWFSSLMGWLVVCASIVSMATLSHAFVGYLGEIWKIPQWPVLIGFLLILGLINFSGIQESSWANFVATCIELIGLLIVLVAGVLFFSGEGASSASNQKISSDLTQNLSWVNIFTGASLAFFAFIGFEDIVNVAEEVKKPEKAIPIAILVATLVAGTLYISVSWISSQILSPEQLSASDSPLLQVVQQSPLAMPKWIFTLIALFAIANTALLNSITASRLLYGMSRQNLLPSALSSVHSKRQTPYVSISFVIPVAILLSLLGNLASLAGITSLILLLVFFCMHLSLSVIKFKEGTPNKGFRIPLPVPILGALATLAVMIFVSRKSQIVALVIIVFGLIALGLYRRFRTSRSKEN